MALNQEQQRAVDASCKEDVIISAGAGSGKTFTLSKKIYEKVAQGEIAPSQLLVLTFTNNAAHEMKERTINQFKEHNSPFANEMMSAHIQTFDSFSQYLVTRYASYLNLPSRLSVADSSLMETKQRDYLDALLDEYYEDEQKRKRLLSSLKKFVTKSDQPFKEMILDLYGFLDKKPLQMREKYLEEYDEKYLSKSFYATIKKQFVTALRREISSVFVVANYLDHDYCDYFMPEEGDDVLHLEEAIQGLKNPVSFTVDISSFLPSSDSKNHYEDVFERLKDALRQEDEGFLESLKTIKTDFPNFFDLRKGSKKHQGKFYRKYLNEILNRYDFLLVEGQGEEDAFFQFKDDIHLLFELEEELRKRLDDYKFRMCYFTFADFSSLALKLLTEERFQDVAEEIRREFKFIMVDEYQDTNDIQEMFLDALTKPCKDGTKAHLFCVGDAKQSIYRFRNSNVALFNRRIGDYQKPGDDHQVIAMNKNYRSCPEILSDINYIFNRYMTKAHGDIDYLNPLQQLRCGLELPPDPLRKNGYGIHRLTYEPCLYKAHDNAKEKEILCIIHDIKTRIQEKRTIVDKGVERPCRYSDFCILVGRKSNYRLFQKLFTENGIPLNVSMKTDLRSINCTLLIKSMLSFIDYFLNHTAYDIKHLFASIARSYIYEYTDEAIYQALKPEDPNDFSRLKEDKVYQDLQTFSMEHKDSKLSSLFLDMLDSFGIVKKLYRIGQIEDNLAKIESLYQIVCSMESIGLRQNDFLQLFESIEKHRMSIDSESVVSIDNAVDLMTIHASKGLERKIVYMPVSENKLNAGDENKKPYLFSDDFGILLHNYLFDITQVDGEIQATSFRIKSLPRYAYEEENARKNPFLDEHVRLFYVALTRAILEIVIVGNKPKSSLETLIKTDNLYGMLSFIPHSERINPSLQHLLENDARLQQTYQNLMYYSSLLKSFDLPLTREQFPHEYEYLAYGYIGKELIRSKLESLYQEMLSEFKGEVLKRFDLDLPSPEAKENDIASFFFADETITSFQDYMGQKEEENEQDEFEDEDDSLPSEPEEGNPSGDESEEFEVSSVVTQTMTMIDCYLHTDKNKNKTARKAWDEAVDFLLPRMLYRKFKTKTLMVEDYQAEDYPDLNELVDVSTFALENHAADVILDKDFRINEEPIEFEPVVHQRASKIMTAVEDEEIQEALEKGTRLHRLMELVSFTTKDTSFITDAEERRLIDRVLSNPIFDHLKEEEVSKEFIYYDDLYQTSGSIDLLIHKDGKFIIVDYKTSDISPAYYDDQLHVYQRNIMKLYGCGKEDMRLILFSLATGKTREVKTQ